MPPDERPGALKKNLLKEHKENLAVDLLTWGK